MRSKIFNIQHAEIVRFECLNGFTQAGSVSAGENPFTDPGTKRMRLIPADKMQESATPISNGYGGSRG